MSRHEVEDEKGRWAFGWDKPLQSFYLQFYDNEAEEDDNPVIWLGATADTAMPNIGDLWAAAKKVGFDIDQPMRALLFGERAGLDTKQQE